MLSPRSTVEMLVPGEQLALDKPWLRLVDGQVQRFVRKPIEDRAVRTVALFGHEPTLASVSEQLEAELDYLGQLGVQTPSAQYSLEVIPKFFGIRSDEYRTEQGLKITTPYIEGDNLDQLITQERLPEMPNIETAVYDLSEALGEYVLARETDGLPFLADIFEPNQYRISNGECLLLDIEPFFASPTPSNCESRAAFARSLGDYVFRNTS